jgi:hypothetical protein
LTNLILPAGLGRLLTADEHAAPTLAVGAFPAVGHSYVVDFGKQKSAFLSEFRHC